MTRPLRIGTRGSRLALTQAELVAGLLRAQGVEVEVVTVVTTGDIRPMDTASGEGAFVDALELALRDGEIDAAVHSAKDMSVESGAFGETDDLLVAAYPVRADPRDALVTGRGGQRLTTLPAGAMVGTDSPRRTGFILAARPYLRVVPLHGNVDTRLRRLDGGVVDALVLAVAGLERLGRADRIDEVLDAARTPPAPGQGAMAVQVRAADASARSAIGQLDDPLVRRAVELERAVLGAHGGGCRAPIGALAQPDRGGLTLLAGSVRPDGCDRRIFRCLVPRGDEADAARSVATRLGQVTG